MSDIKPKWVKFGENEGPLWVGEKDEKGRFLHRFYPTKPVGIWGKILGVVADSEGNHDTVVMYDGTGVTFGAFQWTFKSGRLQKLLEYFKSVTIVDFESDKTSTLFDNVCSNGMGNQVFEKYGFSIKSGYFCDNYDGDLGRSIRLNMNKEDDVRSMLRICSSSREKSMDICKLFAKLGQNSDVQTACEEYSRIEFAKSLDYVRPALGGVGGTIRALITDDLWDTYVPAIFFNLFQNSPKGAFDLFKKAMNECWDSGYVSFDKHGYVADYGKKKQICDTVWRGLCASCYADWGCRSKKYISSKGKNRSRVFRIADSIAKYYGEELEMFGEIK